MPHPAARLIVVVRPAKTVRIYIDFSVFTNDGAFGNVHGHMDPHVLPRKGETISFNNPKAGVAPVLASGFSYQLTVEHVVHSPQNEAGSVSLALSDVVLTTVDEARSLARYFEEGFGLYVDEYE